MRKNKLLFVSMGIISSIFLSGIIVSQVDGNTLFTKAVDNTLENKIVLNGSNKLTASDGGTWDSPRTYGSSFVRKTNKGNDITFKSGFGRSLTSVDGTDFCIARDANGWICNQTPIQGITKISISVGAQKTIRFDFSGTTVLDNYTYEQGSFPEYVNYHTEELVGSSTYTIEIPSGTFAKYFRFQPVSSSNNWIKYINIEYTCQEIHVHSFEHHDHKEPYRDTDGNIEYDYCAGCGKYYDSLENEITKDETVIKSRQVAFAPNIDSKYHFDGVFSTSNDLIIDFKLDIDKHVNVALMKDSSWDNYLGYFEIYGNGTLGSSYKGVTIAPLSDGYLRVTFDFQLINKVNNKVGEVNDYESIKWIYVRGDWTTGSGYMDVDAKNDAVVLRGNKVTAGTNKTIEFDKNLNLNATVNIDIYVSNGSTNKFSVMIGNWDTYFGYYSIGIDPSVQTTGQGISYTTLDDGYLRCTFKLSELTKTSGIPSSIEFVFISGKWTTASGYVDVSYVESTDSPVMGDIY